MRFRTRVGLDAIVTDDVMEVRRHHHVPAVAEHAEHELLHRPVLVDPSAQRDLLAGMLAADGLVLLSNVDGVFDGPPEDPASAVIADWSDFRQDYETEEVAIGDIDFFKASLHKYFDSHKMQVDWNALSKLHIEEVVNNLVLILNLSIDSKQRLLEAPTVVDRLELFSALLDVKKAPILSSQDQGKRVN